MRSVTFPSRLGATLLIAASAVGAGVALAPAATAAASQAVVAPSADAPAFRIVGVNPDFVKRTANLVGSAAPGTIITVLDADGGIIGSTVASASTDALGGSWSVELGGMKIGAAGTVTVTAEKDGVVGVATAYALPHGPGAAS
ncbi:hypothetical protein [Frondihabitans australicus]|uniref:Uncharacterized protein n=1 Tax=Frondihabitans australicus TaxID=386892 RepID=A0A495IAB7_9MICO|nr:hypothetical protein [Frondihabitans australicus]RKR72963.1 hypothetical protein C8E83_0045 [Frondihabitans australicus]